MLIMMRNDATAEQITGVCEKIRALGFRPHSIPGAQRVAIGITGNQAPLQPSIFEYLPGVAEAIPVSRPYKLVSREFKAGDSVVRVGKSALIGGRELVVIAGPCAIENREQTFAVAERVAGAGVTLFRGGAYKPRTSPYSFQGLGEEGLRILAEVRERFGLAIVTEAVDENSLRAVEEHADMIQIGSRNMQNFSLLKLAGRSSKPVLLKRGLSATLDEWLMAAEYVVSEGNYNVVLCERGVRTFADHTRNTLDLSVIPAVQKVSHLPVIVDPSHGTGRREKVLPLARAGIAVGASGIMVEVHADPERALCDGPQSIVPADFEQLVRDVRYLAPLTGRSFRGRREEACHAATS